MSATQNDHHVCSPFHRGTLLPEPDGEAVPLMELWLVFQVRRSITE